MLLWLKKILKPKWLLEEVCDECYERHYCGGCGRGIDCFAGYFYTYAGAEKAAREWVEQQRGEDTDTEYEVIVTKRPENIVVSLRYDTKTESGECTMSALISERRYW